MSHIFNIIILCAALCSVVSFVLGVEINLIGIFVLLALSAVSYGVFRHALYWAAVRREVEDIRKEVDEAKERRKGKYKIPTSMMGVKEKTEEGIQRRGGNNA